MVHRLTSGKTLPDEVLSQVTSKSDGVPIFVEELTRMLLESDLLKEAGDHYELTGPLTALAIPSTLQDSLTARLDRLSSAREVAQLAAVLGREFTYELIHAISPLAEEMLGSHLQQLVDAEFLYQRGLPPDANYTFKHALIQDAAYESLLRSRRQQYHQQSARALGERFSDTMDAQPELLAHHYFEAGLTQEAVTYWLRAGEQALSIYAWEEALAHFQRGLRARAVPLSGTETARDAEVAALLFGLARAQSGTTTLEGEMGETVNILSRAFEFYADSGDADQCLAITEYPLPIILGRRTGMHNLIARALQLVPPDSQRAGALLSRYGQVMGRQEGDYDAAQEAFARAVTIARKNDDSVLEYRTLANAIYVDFFHLRFENCLEKTLRAIDLSGKVDDPTAASMTHYGAAQLLSAIGDAQGARVQATACLAVVEHLRDKYRLSGGYYCLIHLTQLEGDLAGARDLSNRALAVSDDDNRILAPRADIEYELGDFDAGDYYLQQLMPRVSEGALEPDSLRSNVALVILLGARRGRRIDRCDIAEAVATSILSSRLATPMISLRASACLALLAIQRADDTAAADQYTYLKPMLGKMLSPPLTVDRLLGLLSQTMGNLDQAAAHFEDALVFCRKAGYRPELAWSCCDYADMLRERDGAGDRAKAIALLDESLAISSELGMRPLMERVLSRREILGA